MHIMALERHFEKFTGGPTRSLADRIFVSLGSTSRFYLNRNAYRALGRPKAVVLHYSRETNTIAIEPSDPRIAISFPFYEARNGWVINGAPFCSHFNIKPTGTERFIEPIVGDDGLMRLNLKRTVTVHVRKRKKEKT